MINTDSVKGKHGRRSFVNTSSRIMVPNRIPIMNTCLTPNM